MLPDIVIIQAPRFPGKESYGNIFHTSETVHDGYPEATVDNERTYNRVGRQFRSTDVYKVKPHMRIIRLPAKLVTIVSGPYTGLTSLGEVIFSGFKSFSAIVSQALQTSVAQFPAGRILNEYKTFCLNRPDIWSLSSSS
jgi:hypothetical protein